MANSIRCVRHLALRNSAQCTLPVRVHAEPLIVDSFALASWGLGEWPAAGIRIGAYELELEHSAGLPGAGNSPILSPHIRMCWKWVLRIPSSRSSGRPPRDRTTFQPESVDTLRSSSVSQLGTTSSNLSQLRRSDHSLGHTHTLRGFRRRAADRIGLDSIRSSSLSLSLCM